MKTTQILLIAVATLLVLPALPQTSAAQDSVLLNRFSPSETPEDDFHLSRPTDFGHVRFGAQLHFDYADDPLVFETVLGDESTETLHIVEHELTGTLGLSLGLADRLVIFAGLPIVLSMDGAAEADVMAVGLGAADDLGLGDLYLGARLRLLGDHASIAALGLQVTATFPTAGDQSYRGDESPSVHPELLFQLNPGPLRLVLNVGVRIRDEVVVPDNNFTFSNELTFGAGVAVPVWTAHDPRSHLDLHAQIYGSTALDDVNDDGIDAGFFGRETTPLEMTFGAKFFHSSGLVLGAAAGPGLNRGFGSPDVRIIGTAAFMTPADLDTDVDTDGDGIMDSIDECDDEPEDVDTYQDEDGCPDVDNDGDGILDSADECPMEPETVNGVDDADGCPDDVGDRDGDGILDTDDSCPDDPEDADGFEDEDGCPDPDNDNDGVMDDDDECRDVPGVIENRGCPDSDRDGDTVVDRRDNCPDEPGTVENHGCAEEQVVRITDTGLEILDKVFFRTNRDVIQRRSHSLLDNVARVLNAHPEITRIRVEGHTDARGRHEYNMDLSQRRAQAVVTYLVDRGSVDQGRLEARGFGPDRPIVPNASNAEEHAENRRVEFNIPDTAGVSHSGNTAGADTMDL